MEPQLTEVGSGVYFVEASHTNFVLVAEGGELTVVDSGYPKDRGLLEDAVAQTGHSLADISAMLLTHAHVDHLGSAEWLRRDHGVPVHTHTVEAPHARGEVDEVISQLDLLMRLWRPKVLSFTLNAVTSGALRHERLAQVSTFEDDEVLDVPGHPSAVFTPGHTSGHSAFHLADRGVLITGDALITVDVWDPGRRGPQLIRPQFNADNERARSSLSRLAGCDAEVVVPGHGQPYRSSPAEAVEEALRA
jgi:glyoxylase-like metal-dependent hydrolase (beta-lactamase superfamily II)